MSSGLDMSFVIGRAQPADGRRSDEEGGSLFRVLVIGDFSGRSSRRSERDAAPTFKPIPIDLDNFERVLERIAPQIEVELPQAPGAPLRVSLRSLDDFEPDSLFARLPLLTRLRELRARLVDPATFQQAAAELRASEAAAPTQPAGPSGGAPAPTEDDASTLARLLGSTPSRPVSSAPAVSTNPAASAVDRLLQRAVAPYIVPNTSHLQQPLIDSLDRAIGDSMRSLLGHPHWRALEGAWRAVDQFVRTVEMDGQVLLELVDASAADVLESLVAAGGDAAAMPLSKALAARRMHEGQEEGYALLVGLYEFGPSAAELALLACLGAVAAREGAAFIGSAAKALALVDAPEAWEGFLDGAPDSASRQRWQAMRASWVAPHVALVWPQLLARLPYGARTHPVSAFPFEELGSEFAHDKLPWRLAALDAAGLLARAYVAQGWSMQPARAVQLDDLPAFTDHSAETPRYQAVAELFMSERQAQALAATGLIALISHRGLPQARLSGWQSIASQSSELRGRWQA